MARPLPVDRPHFVRELFATGSKRPRSEVREILIFIRGFSVRLGACGSTEPNGIQEVARSIRVSSTNKIKYLALFQTN